MSSDDLFGERHIQYRGAEVSAARRREDYDFDSADDESPFDFDDSVAPTVQPAARNLERPPGADYCAQRQPWRRCQRR